MRQSVWEPDEERFINRLRQAPSERQLADIKERCRAELKKAMQSFLGKPNTQLTQETINYLTQQIVKKFQNEIDERGFSYELQVSMTPM